MARSIGQFSINVSTIGRVRKRNERLIETGCSRWGVGHHGPGGRAASGRTDGAKEFFGRSETQDATQAILAAFDKYQVVAMHSAHRLKENSEENVEAAAALIGEIVELRAFASDAQKRAVAVRGSVQQIALAEWLSKALDQPMSEHDAVKEYPTASTDDIVRIFCLGSGATKESIADLVARIRSGSKIRRASSYSPGRVLVLRGTAEQLELAERQIK